MSKQDLMELLKTIYDIKSERDLDAALKSAEKLNIGIMTTRKEANT